jgi:diguanylate cyclase (GGDEF)-like protein/PAS domain S-box-containing protein
MPAATQTIAGPLNRALVDSRQRYKDLVELSPDCAWETDETGCFTFLTRPLLGWHPDELIGRAAATLAPDDAALFAAREIATGEIWMYAADGARRCLRIDARPIDDAAGRWCGARGLARDITKTMHDEDELRRTRHRDALAAHVVRALSDTADPRAAIKEVLRRTALALDADAASVWSVAGGHATSEIASFRSGVAGDLGDPASLHAGDAGVLSFAIRHAGSANGVIAATKATREERFSADERILMKDVAERLGVALAQVEHVTRITAISRTDPLTGLANRRAFLDDVQRHIRRLSVAKQPATLVFLDLDNFKALNDRFGHAAGDEALQEAADLVREEVRPTDLAARFGGDEFVIWLDGVDAETAAQRVAAMMTRCNAKLAARSADADLPLGFSAGCVTWTPAGGTGLEALLAQADAAMYAAKRAKRA